MKQPYKARVNERHFLNLPGYHDGAYVVAYVENTTERSADDGEAYYPSGRNPHPRFILEIADCSNRINLEFEIYSALNRQNSFHKIDTLIKTLEEFKQGMAKECEVYRKRQRQIDLEKEAEKKD